VTNEAQNEQEVHIMLLLVVVLILLFGGGGFYGYRSGYYGHRGMGGHEPVAYRARCLAGAWRRVRPRNVYSVSVPPMLAEHRLYLEPAD
jgi:hypothetical protein